ncbi:MAG: hypothetical protein ACT4OV_14715, partial [Microthrixaceae bacterium]
MALAVDDVIDRCQGALAEHTPALAVRDVLRELVADPGAGGRGGGARERGGGTPPNNPPHPTHQRGGRSPR